MLNAIDDALLLYQEVCGLAALVEFKIRLLAENQLGFQANKLEDIEDKLLEWLKKIRGLENFDHWKKMRQLRNKVLHSEFQQARSKLQELGHKTGLGFVKKLSFTDFDTQEILSSVDKARSDHESYPFVSDQEQSEVGILGWLMELYSSGDLEMAKMVFQSASKDLDELIKYSGS
ncbi:MAG: hypothetical protein MUF77_07200 [Leptospira sp.]|jgi:hypothetical protein|nr:hypothetical protein [Leptospira sp.]